MRGYHAYPQTNLSELCHDLIKEGRREGVPARIVAERMGRDYTLLMNELSPARDGHKFGADHLLAFMVAAETTEPLRYLASRLHCAVIPLPRVAASGRARETQLLRTVEELGDLVREFNASLADGQLSRAEKTSLRKEVYDLVTAALAFAEGLED